MDRRKFLQISVAGAAAVSIPMIYCQPGKRDVNEALAFPVMLSHLCDDETIRDLGKKYIAQFPADKKAEQLKKVLLTTKDGGSISINTDTDKLVTLLQQKIQDDFKSSQTIMLKGWVISITEARQCALYSLKQV